MLKIEKLTKTYKKEKKAVDNLSLSVAEGDIYGFIGHNGAGKTTAIKCITGILNFEEGDIFIDGNSIKKDPIKCKSIFSYLPDTPDLYTSMTSIQYLNFICDIFKVGKNDRVDKIKKYSDMFEVSDKLGDTIFSCSHGTRQKIAIISSLIHSPKLLILDEPFVGLDPKATHIFKECLKEECKKGVAIFFSTHLLYMAQEFCNKLAIINSSRLVVSGKTKEVIGNNSLEELFLELVNSEK